ncbi:hypothetical protein [Hymenobacter metallicola]|uniref:Uncharacterized protein n=1 Tax=Hymenobacter metallicola TaxID=2563114 RepID=A0A4Z0QKG8_9BACT|nr:hypothetical protein [Hymenobacter metallicola]TGE29749.1 hypothetical protein E5K02_09900 [Hymenobacter metallicola]
MTVLTSMTEKVGLIRNPLTIIAIFAGIAEVSGTIVAPLLEKENQKIFVWFLMFFPTLLIGLFFYILYNKNKVLYAPSDFADERHIAYIFDKEASKSVPVEVVYDSSSSINVSASGQINVSQEGNLSTSLGENSVQKDNVILDYSVLSTLYEVGGFVRHMSTFGYNFDIYNPVNKEDHPSINPIINNRGLWIGTNVPLNIAKQVIQETTNYYRHIEYIALVGGRTTNFLNNDKNSPRNMVFVGGATKAAIDMYNLRPMSAQDLSKVQTLTSVSELHSFLLSFVVT